MKKMDEIFRNNLNEHESDYSQDVWTNIDSALFDTPKRSIRSFYIIFSAGVLSLTLISIYFFNQTSKDLPKHEQILALNDIEGGDYHKSLDFVENNDDAKISKNENQGYNTVFQNGKNVEIEANESVTSASGNNILDDRKIKDEVYFQIEEKQNQESFPSNEVKEIKNELQEVNYISIPNKVYEREIIPELEKLSVLVPKRTFKKPQECPRFYKDIWVPYGWIEYGSMYPIRSLEAKEEIYQDYLTSRNSMENERYSFDFAAGFGMKSPGGIVTELGIQYSQIQEKFSYVDPESIHTTTVITIDTLISGGQQVITMDTSFVDLPGSRRIVTNNKLRFVNFPFMLGYERNVNQSFSVAIKGGLIMNFSFRQKGRFLDETDTPVFFSSNQLNKYEAFKSRVGLSYMAGIQLNYHFTSQITVFASPQVKLIPSTITLEEYSLNQTYINPTITIGAKFSI